MKAIIVEGNLLRLYDLRHTSVSLFIKLRKVPISTKCMPNNMRINLSPTDALKLVWSQVVQIQGSLEYSSPMIISRGVGCLSVFVFGDRIWLFCPNFLQTPGPKESFSLSFSSTETTRETYTQPKRDSWEQSLLALDNDIFRAELAG